MAFVALPLDAVMHIMVGIEDIANIADRLINFQVGIANIWLLEWSVPSSSLAWLVLGPWLARVDGVVSSRPDHEVLAVPLVASERDMTPPCSLGVGRMSAHGTVVIQCRGVGGSLVVAELIDLNLGSS